MYQYNAGGLCIFKAFYFTLTFQIVYIMDVLALNNQCIEGKFLCKFEGRKKVIKCSKSLPVLKDEIKKVFSISRDVHIKYFHDAFDEWVDVDQEEELPETAKLNIVLSLHG